MANWYYDDLGDEVGPVSPEVMRQRVADGTIVARTRVRREDGEWLTAEQVPGLLTSRRAVPVEQQGDSTGGVIPYKNPHALIAYYLAIPSLLPWIGLPFGATAFVLGIIGIKRRNQNPIIKGSIHAWIGIVLGGTTALLWLTSMTLAIVALASR